MEGGVIFGGLKQVFPPTFRPAGSQEDRIFRMCKRYRIFKLCHDKIIVVDSSCSSGVSC